MCQETRLQRTFQELNLLGLSWLSTHGRVACVKYWDHSLIYLSIYEAAQHTPLIYLVPHYFCSSGAMRTTYTATDGMTKPLPNARAVSNTLLGVSASSDLSTKFSHMLPLWGQFLDHDITKTPTVTPVSINSVYWIGNSRKPPSWSLLVVYNRWNAARGQVRRSQRNAYQSEFRPMILNGKAPESVWSCIGRK